MAPQAAAPAEGSGRADLAALRRSVRGARVRMRDAAAGVRRRVWVAAAAALVGLAAALLLLPGHGASARARSDGPDAPRAVVAPTRPPRSPSPSPSPSPSVTSDSDSDPDSVGERGCHRPRRRRHSAARGTGSLHRGRHVQLPERHRRSRLARRRPRPSGPGRRRRCGAATGGGSGAPADQRRHRRAGGRAVHGARAARSRRLAPPGRAGPLAGGGSDAERVREVALLEPLAHRAEEPGGVRPVHDAVVVAEREVHRGADRDGLARRPRSSRSAARAARSRCRGSRPAAGTRAGCRRAPRATRCSSA